MSSIIKFAMRNPLNLWCRRPVTGVRGFKLRVGRYRIHFGDGFLFFLPLDFAWIYDFGLRNQKSKARLDSGFCNPQSSRNPKTKSRSPKPKSSFGFLDFTIENPTSIRRDPKYKARLDLGFQNRISTKRMRNPKSEGGNPNSKPRFDVGLRWGEIQDPKAGVEIRNSKAGVEI